MRMWILAGITLSAACAAHAQDRKGYELATLVRMDSANCGFAENDGKPIAGEIAGTDAKHKKTEQVLCQEYVLQTDRVVYRVRPTETKHTFLLPIGQQAEFRLRKDKMLLRVLDSKDNKEREYMVVSVTARTEAGANQSAARTPNP
ncbi:MAG TPA: hypothetical protein VJN42_09270 [Candidatus Acidoferrum sp.]|nr:hypothetical protein [Candidatus Acidoferrum sp.]